MLFIPGFLISLVTFPGVMVHELAHKRCCDRYGVRVHEVCYFRLGNPAGYVAHEEPASYRDSFVISVAPFLLNSLLALALFALVVLRWGKPDGSGLDVDHMGILGGVLVWLGLSIAMHAFPSTGDAKNIWTRTKRGWRDAPLALLALPVVALIYAANLLSVLWFDAIYAIGLLVVALAVITALPL